MKEYLYVISEKKVKNREYSKILENIAKNTRNQQRIKEND